MGHPLKISSILLTSLAAGVILVAAPQSAQAVILPASESNLFILDVSGSTNSVALWKNLKVSIISKLSQPFGNPITKSLKLKSPVDVSITSVAENSQNSPIFSIVAKSDAKQIWATLELAFGKLNDARLVSFSEELFGSSGVWTVESKILTQDKIIVPSTSACKKSTINSMSRGKLLGRASAQKKDIVADEICKKIIAFAQNFKAADEYFSKPICSTNAKCSDVAGVIFRATSLAADLAGQKKDKINGKEVKSKLCIAIASDMLHDSPGMTKSSILNSKQVATTAKTLEEAKKIGGEAAKSVGINFSQEITTRAVMVGIGSGPKPIALERNAYLLAYWQGFWAASGVNQTNQEQSLNQACA
jgi:hypothetical protein